MAPEQIDGKTISAKSDVFALGKAGGPEEPLDGMVKTKQCKLICKLQTYANISWNRFLSMTYT